MTNEVRELFEFVASGGRSVLYDYGSSRAASTQKPREWSLDKNGVIVSKPIEQGQVYKCGTHDYEIKSLTEFNQHIESHDHSSKAASTAAVNPVREIFEFLNGRFE